MSFVPKSEMQKKLLLLYICQNFNLPLTEDQFIKIVMDNEWMDFVDFKIYLNELMETKQVSFETHGDISYYVITAEGEKALKIFAKKLPQSIKASVTNYFLDNFVQIKKETLVESKYKHIENNSYKVTCTAREKDSDIMSITLYMPTEEYAKKVCKNWDDESSDIYQFIISKLADK